MTRPAIHILMIEDNQTDVLLLQEVLCRDLFSSFILSVAERLSTGLEKLCTDPFDLVLLDLDLPDSQGLDTFHKLHAGFPDVPVVVLTGLMDEQVALAAVQSGAQDYLVKGPASWEVASRAIRYAVERGQTQAALRKSETQYRLLFENAPLGILSATPEGQITEVNAAALQLVGSPSVEATKNINLLNFPPLVQSGMSAAFQSCIENVRTISGESRYTSKWGKSIYIKYHITPVLNAVGKIILVQVIIEDITERRKVDEALREINQTLQALIQSSPVGITIIDSEGYLKLWSPSNEYIFGWSESEVMGKMIPYIPEDKREEHRQLRQLVLKGEAFTGIEVRRQRKDGTPVDISLSTAPLVDGQGTIIGITAVSIDITERKRVEEALRESEARYRLATLATKDVIWEWNSKTKQLSWTENAGLVFGYSAEEVGPDESWWDEHIHPEDRQRVTSKIDALIESNETIWSEEYRFLLKDGSYAYISDHAYIDRDEAGKAIRMVGAMSNISERKRAEDALHDSESRYRSLFEDSPISLWEEDFSAVKKQLDSLRQAGVSDFRAYFEANPQFVAECASLVKVVDVNKAVVDLYKANDKEDLIRNLSRILTSERGAEFADELILIAKGYTYFRKESVNQTLEGDRLDISLTWSVMPGYEDELSRVIVSIMDLTERKRAEKALEQRTRDLGERVKELRCLFDIANLANKHLLSLEETLQGIVDIIPSGREYPDLTCAQLTLNGQTFSTDNFNETAWKQVSPILIHGEHAGSVEVHYLQEMPSFDEGPFLKEEQALLDTITQWIGNIASRKQAERALQESEERFRSLYNNATIGLYRTTPAGQILTCNPAAVRLLGFESFEELAKRNLEEDGFEPDYPRAEFRERMERDGFVIGLECEWTRKDGTPIFVRESATVIRDNQENILYYDGTFEDITLHKQAEKALRESEERFRTLIEQSSEGIMLVGEEGNILEWNQAMERITGFSRTQAIHRPVWDIQVQLIPDERRMPDAADVTRAVFTEALKTGELPRPEKRIEVEIATASGERKIVAQTVFAIQTASGYRLGSIVLDISEHKRAEQALRESEEHYRTLFEHLPIPAYTKNLEGKYTSCNSANQKYFALDPVGQGDADFLVPDEAATLQETDLRVMESGEALTVEELFNSTLLGKRCFLSRKVPLRDGDGNITGVLGASIDITEQKQAEAALEASEKRFRTWIENSSDILTVLDLNGIIQYQSPSIKRLLGYEQEELLGTKAFDLLHPDDIESIAALFFEKIQGPGGNASAQCRLRHRDGSWRTMEAVGRTFMNEHGEWTGLIHSRDITERKMAEEAVKQKEKRFRALIENGQDNISLLDKDGTLLWESPSTIRTLGYEQDEFLGNNIMNLVHPNDVDRVIDRFQQLLQEPRGTRRDTFRLRHQNGEWLWVEAIASNLLDEPSVQAVVINYRDITERKQAEEALKKSEADYRLLFNNANDVIVIFEPRDEIILEANNRACQVYGFTHDELVGMSVKKLTKDVPGGEAQINILLERGTYQGLETVHFNRCGEELHFLINASIIEYQGRKAVFSINRDITERKRAEETIRLNEKKFKTLFEIAPVGISVLDREHHIMDTNYALQRITGLRKNELVNGAWKKRTYLRPDGTVMATDELATTRALKENMPIFDVETGIVTDDRGIVWTEMSAAPLDMPDASLVVITQDISERKLSEQTLRQRLAELETLYESGLSLSQLLEPREIGQKIIDVLAEKLDWYHTTVRLYHQDTNSLELLAYNIAEKINDQERQSIGERFKALIAQPGDGLTGWAVLYRETVRCEDIHQDPRYIETIPGLHSGLYVPIKTGERVLGVISVESEKPGYFNAEDEHLAVTVAAQAAVAFENIRLFKDLQKSNNDLFRAYDETIEGWSHALDLRDKETEGHTQRVTALTEKLARAMGISDADVVHIRRGALLHDIGKMGVPDRILLKPDKLTEEEWIIMREHPVHAYNLLSRIEFLRPALNIPHYHHERWDGSGYPQSLQGEQIPLEARIFAVIDVYDALTSDRPYRPAWPKNKVISYILEQSGIHFDPQIVDMFVKLINGE